MMSCHCLSYRLCAWSLGLSLVLLGHVVPNTGHTADSPETNDASQTQAGDTSGPVWSGVRRMKQHDEQSHTVEAASGIVAGTFLMGYGVYEATSSRTYLGAEITSWALVLSGATALGSALYQSGSAHAGAQHAESLLTDDELSQRAARAYLRYRSRRARQRRIMGGIGSLSGGVASGGMLAAFAFSGPPEGTTRTPGREVGLIAIGATAAGLLVGGAFSLATKTKEEKIYQSLPESDAPEEATTEPPSSPNLAVAPTLLGSSSEDETGFGARLNLVW